MRQRILLHFLIFVLGLLPLKVLASHFEISQISFLNVNSAITPATYDYLNQHFREMPKSSLVVIKLNTPGGLISTTKDIITMFGREKRPVVVWITPEGAGASSAGAIIASAAHFIFMSPGTNMGAATPVGLGEDIKEGDGRKKAMNDLTSMVRSLSNSRGRPSAPFEKMITAAESYTDKEALQLGIINGIISNQEEILDFINGKKIIIDGTEQTLSATKMPAFKDYDPSFGQKLLEVLANPSTAYFLFIIGVALVYIELQAPGGYIAGSFGICALLLAAIAFQVLPLNWGSMGLIAVGLILLILEIFITSYGLLSLVGIGALFMGSLFLFQGDTGFITIDYPIIFSTLAGVITALLLIVWYLIRERKKQKHSSENFFSPKGAKGIVLTKNADSYQVKVKGEIWKASAEENLNIGDHVEVLHVNPKQLLIQIKKITE